LHKAIDDYNEVVRINPEFDVAYFWRGAAYKRKGEQAKAETDFAKAKDSRWRRF
jgi:tetratricopeptide (TPR) repeat protein